jgi:hypothetical protein
MIKLIGLGATVAICLSATTALGQAVPPPPADMPATSPSPTDPPSVTPDAGTAAPAQGWTNPDGSTMDSAAPAEDKNKSDKKKAKPAASAPPPPQ